MLQLTYCARLVKVLCKLGLYSVYHLSHRSMYPYDPYPKCGRRRSYNFNLQKDFCYLWLLKMESQKRIICRLCFKIQDNLGNFKPIEGDIKDILDRVLQKIDFVAIQSPVMCTNCADTLMKCLDFKIKCINTHDYIAPFINKKDDIKLDLIDVYSKSESGTGVLDVQDVCGLCMSPMKTCSTLSVDIEGGFALQKMIERCVPGLDMNVIKEPIICVPCHGSLENYYCFLTNCLMVEERIKKYRENQGMEVNGELDLSRLLQFATTDVTGNVGGSSTDFIKVENQFSEEIGNTDGTKINDGGDLFKFEQIFCGENTKEEFELKNESFMDTDELKFDTKQNFTPQITLACNEDFIKIEEPCCGEDGLKEKKVEMEDHKCVLHEEVEIKTDESDLKRFENGILSEPKINKCDLKIHLLICNDPSEVLNKCESCSYETNDKRVLSKHLLKHKAASEVIMNKCDFCLFQTKHKKNLSRHLRTHKDPSDITMYKCYSCSYQTKDKRVLNTHLLSHKDPSELTMYKCDSCSYETKDKRGLGKHLWRHKVVLEVTVHKCVFCSFQTKHKSSLNRHLLNHKDPSEITMYKCYSCSYQTKDKRVLKKHLLNHKDPVEVRMYKCDSCSYQTKDKSYLKKHLFIHKDASEVAVYKCESCPFQTKHKHSVQGHLLQHKDFSEVTMYKCDNCLYQTKHKGNLKIHLLIHKEPTEVTMYKCDSCSFETKYKNSLASHLVLHKDSSEATMYKCDSCSYETKDKRALRWHLLRHKDIKEITMHKCNFCSYQNEYKTKLNRHMLKHRDPSEVTMYKCDSCSFQTKRKDGLKRHILKHTDPSKIPMHKCDSCSYQTICKRNIDRHLQKHKDPSEVTMYKCDSCPFQTKRKDYLKKHLLKHKDTSKVTAQM